MLNISELRIFSPIIAFSIYVILPSILLYKNSKFHKIQVKFPLMISSIAFVLLFVSFYFINLYNGWYVNSYVKFRPLNISIEEICFAFLWPLSLVTTYDYIRKKKRRIKKKNLEHILIFMSIFIMIFVISILVNLKEYLVLPYAYLEIYPFLVVPILFAGRKYLSKKLLLISIINFILSFLFEVAALSEKWWIFGGQYIVRIYFFNIAIPFEEIFFWMLLGGIIIPSLYDYVFA